MAGHMVAPARKQREWRANSESSFSLLFWKFPSPIQCNVLPTFRVSVHLHESSLEIPSGTCPDVYVQGHSRSSQVNSRYCLPQHASHKKKRMLINK